VKSFFILIFAGFFSVLVFAQEVQNVKVCANELCSNSISVKPDVALQIVNSILAEGKENSLIKFCDFSQKERVCKSNHILFWNFSLLPPFLPQYTTINSLNFTKAEDGKFFYSIKAATFGISVLCNKVEALFALKESQVVLDSTNYCNWLGVGNIVSNLKIKVKEIYPLEKRLLADLTAGIIGTGIGTTSGLAQLSFEGFDWITASLLIKETSTDEQGSSLFAGLETKVITPVNQASIGASNGGDTALKEAALKEAALKEAALKEAALKEAALKEAALKEAALKEAALKEATLKEAALKEAALKEAALKEAALKEAALKEAALKEAALKKNTAPTSVVEVFSQARLNKETLVAPSKVDSSSRMKLTALIIGNGGYKSGFLKNPRNDAEEIAKKLTKFNFDVTAVYDTSREKLIQALDSYSHKSKDSDVSIFFYAGHGVQVNGMNYLIPVDMDLGSVSQVTLRGIPLNNVIEEFMPSKTKLIFLDACRDNPMLLSKTRNMSRGLAPVNVPSGTLIAFSTKDGSVAQDGDDKHSPFTAALLKHLDAPDDISVVLRKVRTEVKRITNGNQEPWDYGSLEGGSLVLSKIGFNN
jgi:uncharacterized protein YjbI with pentapeptide repeats